MYQTGKQWVSSDLKSEFENIPKRHRRTLFVDEIKTYWSTDEVRLSHDRFAPTNSPVENKYIHVG